MTVLENEKCNRKYIYEKEKAYKQENALLAKGVMEQSNLMYSQGQWVFETHPCPATGYNDISSSKTHTHKGF